MSELSKEEINDIKLSEIERKKGSTKKFNNAKDLFKWLDDNKKMKSYEIGGNWGDKIEISGTWKKDSNIQRVAGWKANIPKIDDVIKIRIESNKIAIFKFIKIELCENVPDMFFADIEFKEYEI